MPRFIAKCGIKTDIEKDFREVSLDFSEEDDNKARKRLSEFRKSSERVGLNFVFYSLLEEKPGKL